MKFEPVNVLRVYYKPAQEKIFVGRLALKNRQLFKELVFLPATDLIKRILQERICIP